MRVVFQILTDSHKWAFPLMGISAWVEITGLILWAVDLWRAMGRRRDTAVASGRLAIGPRTKGFEVIENYPETVALFRQFGFSMIENPMAQRIFARSISLEQACRLKHVDFAAFEGALKELVRKSRGGPDNLIQLAGPLGP